MAAKKKENTMVFASYRLDVNADTNGFGNTVCEIPDGKKLDSIEMIRAFERQTEASLNRSCPQKKTYRVTLLNWKEL